MRIAIDFERPPMRAVYRAELHVERVSDPLTAAAQAGAMLQLSEASSVRILSVAVERTVHTPRPIGRGACTDHNFEANPGMYDSQRRFCAKCGMVEP